MKKFIVLIMSTLFLLAMVSCGIKKGFQHSVETDYSSNIVTDISTDINTDETLSMEDETLQNNDTIIGIEPMDYPNPYAVSEYEKLTENQKVAYEVLSEALCDIVKNGPDLEKRYNFPIRVSWFDYKLAFNIIGANFTALRDVVFSVTSNDSQGTQDYVDSIFLHSYGGLWEDYQNFLDMNDEAEKILLELEHDGSEYGKAFAIAKWMVDNITYPLDYEKRVGDGLNTAYVAIMTKEAVCDGYAKAYDFLCKKAGLETIYVYIMAPEFEHAWNMICIDEKWYHIDVTWMDSSNDMYENFMMPDSICYSNGHIKPEYYWNQEENKIVTPIANSYDLYKDYFATAEEALSYFEGIELSTLSEYRVLFDKETESNSFSIKNQTIISDSTGRRFVLHIIKKSDFMYTVKFMDIEIE